MPLAIQNQSSIIDIKKYKNYNNAYRGKGVLQMRTITNEQIIEMFEAEGIETTDNLNESIYILDDGTMISGMFYDGDRTEDHRVIEVLFDDIDRYTNNFWELAHERTGMIQHVPECNQLLINKTNVLSDEQLEIVEQMEFVEYF